MYNLVLVPPTAKERVVQITGPSEENISLVDFQYLLIVLEQTWFSPDRSIFHFLVMLPD